MSLIAEIAERTRLAIETAALEDKLRILEDIFFTKVVPNFKMFVKTDLQKQKFWKLVQESDPTRTKTYLQWIITKGISKWTDKSLRILFEDLPKFNEIFERYEFLKQKNKLEPGDKDINRFKNFEELAKMMEKYKNIETDSERDKKKKEEQAFYDNNKAVLFYDSPTLKVVIPKNKDAAVYFGKHTQWCTSAKRHNQFARYNKGGPLYIILYKQKNQRWQFHFTKYGLEIADETDEGMGIRDFEKQPFYNELLKIFAPIADKIVKEGNIETVYPLLSNPTELQTIQYLDNAWLSKADMQRMIKDGRMTKKVVDAMENDGIRGNLVLYRTLTNTMKHDDLLWYAARSKDNFDDVKKQLSEKDILNLLKEHKMIALWLNKSEITRSIIDFSLFPTNVNEKREVADVLEELWFFASDMSKLLTMDDFEKLAKINRGQEFDKIYAAAMVRQPYSEVKKALIKEQATSHSIAEILAYLYYVRKEMREATFSYYKDADFLKFKIADYAALLVRDGLLRVGDIQSIANSIFVEFGKKYPDLMQQGLADLQAKFYTTGDRYGPDPDVMEYFTKNPSKLIGIEVPDDKVMIQRFLQRMLHIIDLMWNLRPKDQPVITQIMKDFYAQHKESARAMMNFILKKNLDQDIYPELYDFLKKNDFADIEENGEDRYGNPKYKIG